MECACKGRLCNHHYWGHARAIGIDEPVYTSIREDGEYPQYGDEMYGKDGDTFKVMPENDMPGLAHILMLGLNRLKERMPAEFIKIDPRFINQVIPFLDAEVRPTSRLPLATV